MPLAVIAINYCLLRRWREQRDERACLRERGRQRHYTRRSMLIIIIVLLIVACYGCSLFGGLLRAIIYVEHERRYFVVCLHYWLVAIILVIGAYVGLLLSVATPLECHFGQLVIMPPASPRSASLRHSPVSASHYVSLRHAIILCLIILCCSPRHQYHHWLSIERARFTIVCRRALILFVRFAACRTIGLISSIRHWRHYCHAHRFVGLRHLLRLSLSYRHHGAG